MTRQALSVTVRRQAMKALSKSVCMPFRALAWPKCQSNIWQSHITLRLSLPLHILSHYSCDVALTKELNHSDAAHGVRSFSRPSGSRKTSKKGIEWGRAIDFFTYVPGPLTIKPEDTQSSCNHKRISFWFIFVRERIVICGKCGSFLQRLMDNTFILWSHRNMKQHYPLILVLALYSRIGFWG